MKMIKLMIVGGAVLLAAAGVAEARVSGLCSNCHTMHNSQGGTSMVVAGTNAGWDGAVISGGAGTGTQEGLLVSDCVGCHSSATDAAIVTVGVTDIPIVYNMVEPAYPAGTLAGGNFYWVTTDDAKGHNVRGITGPDGALATAPASVGCANSCHVSLTLTDAETDGHRKNGCRGCHNSVKHHGLDTAGEPVTAAGGWYRFLSAPAAHALVGGGGVHGIEDSDWEYAATDTEHNTYYGGTGADTESPQSIGKYCAGCHYNFHSPGFPTTFWGADNGGGADPWLRHPADAVIPAEYEYTGYTVYNPLVPVGRPEVSLTGFNANEVRPGTDKVICISCHRAHGSPYPDMLRWDYNTMTTGATGASAGTGCFTCHTTKDGV